MTTGTRPALLVALAVLLVSCTPGPNEIQDVTYVVGALTGVTVSEDGLPVADVKIDVVVFRGECGAREGGSTPLPRRASIRSAQDGSFEKLLALPLLTPFEGCLELVATPPETSGLKSKEVSGVVLDFRSDSRQADTVNVTVVLARLALDDVIPEDRIAEELVPQIDRHRSVEPGRVLRRIADGAAVLAPVPRTALRVLCAADIAAVRTVTELCERVRVLESKLRAAWKPDFGACSPKRVLDWWSRLVAMQV